MDVKWNTLTEKLLRMNDRPRICLLLPLPRPPAELPLADAINLDVAQFLSNPDDDPVETTMPPLMPPLNFLPSSPLAGRSSRMPTASSNECWEVVGSTASSPLAGARGGEYLPLDRYKELGYGPEVLDTWTDAKYIHPHGLCYRIYIDEEMIPQELQKVQRTPKDRQLPSSSLTKPPPKAPPKPPLNPFPPPPKAAPESMGPPPVTPPVKAPPNTKPSKPWKKKAPREYRCQRCGHGNLLSQFM